jgi:hypothetical protein
MNEYLKDLKLSVYEDGNIDEREVKMLRDILSQGIGEDEAEVLLDLNTVLSGFEHPASFETLFVEALTGFVLGGGTAVTAEKWAWLKGHVLRDGSVDGLERRLLENIHAAAATVPDELAAMVGAH